MGLKKKPEAGPGFCHTRHGLDLFKYIITQKPLIYIYIYIRTKKTLLPLIFHTQPSHSSFISLTTSLSSPSLSHGLTLFSLSHSLSLTDSTSSFDLCRSHHHTISLLASSFVNASLKIITCLFLSFFIFFELRSVFSKCSSAKICHLRQNLCFIIIIIIILGSLLGA